MSRPRMSAGFLVLAFLAVVGSVGGAFGEDGVQGPQLRRRPHDVAVPGEESVRQDSRERLPAESKAPAIEELSRAVDGELRDLAAALRRLDQSYAIRGIQSRKAATAGSVFVDWRARGVDLPRSFQPAPPPPRYFDCQPSCRDVRRACGPCCDDDCDACRSDVGHDGCDRCRGDFSSLFTFRTDSPVVWKLKLDDAARCDAAGWLTAGAVRVTAIDQRLADAVRAANAWTIEFDVDVPRNVAQASLATFGESLERSNLALRLEEGSLVATFRTAVGDQVARHDVPLCRLDPGRRHVAVSYAPGRLTTWVDGTVASTTNSFSGSLRGWTPQTLTLGQCGGVCPRARLASVVFMAVERVPEAAPQDVR